MGGKKKKGKWENIKGANNTSQKYKWRKNVWEENGANILAQKLMAWNESGA
jgi:hypothetical protein